MKKSSSPRLAISIFAGLLLGSVMRAADQPQVVEIWPEGVPGLRADATPEKVENARVSNVHRPTLTLFPAPADKANGTAVIICPGGGYVRLSVENEGSLVAQWLNSLGVSAYVLHYRMVEYGHPAPLRDVLRAVRFVRSHATEWGVKPDRVGVLGASAGGHLAATAATLFDDPEGRTGAELDKLSARPDFAVLLYPVITMKLPNAHAGSRKALLGANPSPELESHMSLELQVTKDTPPTFIVQSQEDKTVPVINSVLFFEALTRAGVKAEMHLYQKGPHGFGMKSEYGPTSEWTKRCEDWLRLNGWLTK